MTKGEWGGAGGAGGFLMLFNYFWCFLIFVDDLWCFLMFFNAWELPGLILDDFRNSQKNMIFVIILVMFRDPGLYFERGSKWIVLRFGDVNFNSNTVILHKKCLSLNEWLNFQESTFSPPKIFKMSQFLKPWTSSVLTPYYSWEHRKYAQRVIEISWKEENMIEKRKRTASRGGFFTSLHFVC